MRRYNISDVGYLASDFGLQDRNDCVIRALANVGKMPYVQARERLMSAGRKVNRGTTHQQYAKLYAECGGKLTLFSRKGKRLADFIEGVHSVNPKGITVGKLLPKLTKGSYIVWVRRHVFAVVDGRVIDTGGGSADTHVIGLYTFGDDV